MAYIVDIHFASADPTGLQRILSVQFTPSPVKEVRKSTKVRKDNGKSFAQPSPVPHFQPMGGVV